MDERALIHHIAASARILARLANVGGMEIAGQIVSILDRHPDLIDAFMKDGYPALSDKGIFLGAEHGSLTFHRALDGRVTTPSELSAAREVQKLERAAGATPRPTR